jgi:DNA-nicking Smr family endonuclease
MVSQSDEHDELDQEEAVELPIDGVLDLHAFHPRDVKELVPDYLQLCQEKNILEVRIIHGKGKGVLRRTVHSLLERMPQMVASYGLAGHGSGSWGATRVHLHPASAPGTTDQQGPDQAWSTNKGKQE